MTTIAEAALKDIYMILDRELNQKCLWCGRDIKQLVFREKPIHIHMCHRCRMDEWGHVRKATVPDSGGKQ